MPKCLVVVESPAKAKTINKFLGHDYVVKASYGHVRDLPKNELGVDVEKDFAPTYEVLKESAKAVKELRDAAAKVDRILLASDPDREGEAIGWHIAALLKSSKKPIERIVFNAITKRNIVEAANNPRPIDENLVNAQQARRVLDRLVGYKLSPLLQFSIRRGLSAGRVQSVAVRMVCDREAEIRAFVPEEYWTLDATLATGKDETFTARLFRYKNEKPEIDNQATMQQVIDGLRDARYAVSSVERKDVRRNPYAPFITSTLQQEASRKLGFSPRRTMRVAQALYEGVTLGDEGSTGIITYMRTDSTRIDGEAIAEVRKYIGDNFEPAMLPEKPNFYAGKRGAQDAHEAIRPTQASRTPESIRQYLDDDQFKLYTLIWRRFVASQMAPAIMDQMTVDVSAGDCVFRATGSLVKFPGFTKLYEETVEDENGDGAQNPLPAVFEGDPLSARDLKPEQHFTKPPPRYTEASLIRALEENGIGRPSTYAPTINIIQERGYVEREKNRLKPTQLGEDVTTMLVADFPDILNVNFTARMEDELDHVEEGRCEWHELLRSFYGKFTRDLDEAQRRVVNTATEGATTCPTCGAPFEVREGRYGMFVACQKYPTCKTTHRIAKKTEPEPTDEICDKCQSPMVIREGRFGRFMACSKYPKCKNTHNVDSDGKKVDAPPKEPPKKTDQKCPKCGNGFLLIRMSGRGEPFYGCEKYPKCKFTKPMELELKCLREGCEGNLIIKRAGIKRFIGCDKYPDCNFTASGQVDKKTPCTKCGHGWTTVMKPRGKPRVRKCPVPACGFEEELEGEE